MTRCRRWGATLALGAAVTLASACSGEDPPAPPAPPAPASEPPSPSGTANGDSGDL